MHLLHCFESALSCLHSKQGKSGETLEGSRIGMRRIVCQGKQDNALEFAHNLVLTSCVLPRSSWVIYFVGFTSFTLGNFLSRSHQVLVRFGGVTLLSLGLMPGGPTCLYKQRRVSLTVSFFREMVITNLAS